MDQQTEAVLKRILAKELHELTPHDKSFLRARSSYVGKRSRQKFASVFDEQPVQAPIQATQVEDDEEDEITLPYIETDTDDDEDQG